MLVCGVLTLAQSAPPAVNPPNPYTTIDRWGMLPAGRQWGGVSAIDIDRDGRSVWVAERCGGGSCADSSLAAFIPDRTPNANPITAAEGVAADIDGNVYGAVVPAEMLQKHVRR